MSGHRPFADLTKDFTLERRERIAAKAVAFGESPPQEEPHDAKEEGPDATPPSEHRRR